MVHLHVGRVVVDGGVAIDRLDAVLRGALLERFAAEPALGALAQPVADALAPQLLRQLPRVRG